MTQSAKNVSNNGLALALLSAIAGGTGVHVLQQMTKKKPTQIVVPDIRPMLRKIFATIKDIRKRDHVALEVVKTFEFGLSMFKAVEMVKTLHEFDDFRPFDSMYQNSSILVVYSKLDDTMDMLRGFQRDHPSVDFTPLIQFVESFQNLKKSYSKDKLQMKSPKRLGKPMVKRSKSIRKSRPTLKTLKKSTRRRS